MATPRACPTLRADATLRLKKRSSRAIAFGSCQRINSPRASCNRARRFSTASSASVSTTPPSRATIRSPAVRTTPNPVFAVPGSMPITITHTHSRSAPGCPARPLGAATGPRLRGRDLLQDLLWYVEIRVHRVDVVMLLEGVHQPEERRRVALPDV